MKNVTGEFLGVRPLLFILYDFYTVQVSFEKIS